MLFIGTWICFTWKPMHPMIENSIAGTLAIFSFLPVGWIFEPKQPGSLWTAVLTQQMALPDLWLFVGQWFTKADRDKYWFLVVLQIMSSFSSPLGFIVACLWFSKAINTFSFSFPYFLANIFFYFVECFHGGSRRPFTTRWINPLRTYFRFRVVVQTFYPSTWNDLSLWVRSQPGYVTSPRTARVVY